MRKNLKRASAIVLTIAVVVSLIGVGGLSSLAAVGSVFTVGGIEYKVLTESGTTGTVQVGRGSEYYPAVNSFTAGALTIPSTVMYGGKAYSVTGIGDYAFCYCDGLTSVTIPSSVIRIGDYAFYFCNSLTSMAIPNNVTSIGNSAFARCGLTNVTIPNSVISIGEYAFGDCSLTSVTIPDSVISIGDRAFRECMLLTSVTISNSVTSIGYGTFSWCDSLTSVTIPNSITSIGGSAFERCGLTSITIPKSVTSIGDSAFYDCSRLVEVFFDGDAPSGSNDTFFGASGAIAYVYKNAKGFPAEGQLWNELVVRYREEEPPVPESTVSVSTVKGRPGDTVAVAVVLENNPGIATMRLMVAYDDRYLTLKSVTDGKILGTSLHSNNYSSPYTLFWDNGELAQNITNNGTIATLNFGISDNAPEDNYEIILSYDYAKYDIIDVDMNPVRLNLSKGFVEVIDFIYGDVDGDVNVTPKDSALLARHLADWSDIVIVESASDVDVDGIVTPRDLSVLKRYLANWFGYETLPYTVPSASQITAVSGMSTSSLSESGVPVINVASATGNVGDIVDVAISLEDNPGIVTMRLEVEYDSSVLRLVEVNDKGALGAQFHRPEYTSPYTLFWENGASRVNYAYNGEIVTLRFEILRQTAETPISVKYNSAGWDIYDVDWNLIHFDVINGTVSTLPSTVSVTGKVKSYGPNNYTTIQLLQNGGLMHETTITATAGSGQQEQSFSFEGVAPGTYSLVITKDAHTKFTVQTLVVGDEDLDLTQDSRDDVKVMVLLCGDLDVDGVIGPRDLAILWSSKNYMKSASEVENKLTDLDGDGTVGPRDLAILWSSANYMKGEVVVG